MAAIAIDYGMIKSAKAEAQRAMDSAALAGASAYLISDPALSKPDSIQARAHRLANSHTVRNVAITNAEVTVIADLANERVTASWARAGMGLWFARMFGSNTMGLTATATAEASESGIAKCVKPAAIPDMWNNAPALAGGGGKNGGTPSESEDLNGDHIWNYVDVNGNGMWDDGEAEPWDYDPGVDTYGPTTTGYGTTFRNGYGTGDWSKTKDYGRQLILQTFSSKDNAVSSFYRTWAADNSMTNADSLASLIRGTSCNPSGVGVNYTQANGGKEPLQLAWEYVINQDAGAHWDNATNTVVGSAYGANWLGESPRVVIVGLYDPSLYAATPNANVIAFTNYAKVWLDQRPCSATTQGLGNCKPPITIRFLGYVEGGAGGTTTGPLVKHLVLVK
jgi:hypothetical protein